MTVMMIDAGGTISSAPDADGRLAGGKDGLAGTGLLRRQVYAGLSEEMTLADMARVRDAVLDALGDPAVSGVIVAHGTDALEETAFLIDLSAPATKPVIVTGAMLPMQAPGSDAPGNLALAIRAASTPGLAAHGVLVAFAGHLIPAASVYKHSSHALDGFGWRFGTAGREDAPPPIYPRAQPLPAVVPDGACPIIALAGGDDGAMIHAALDHGARGLVLMALGRGNASAEALAGVRRAVAAGVPVAITSRCPVGGTGADYATGAALAEAGAVFAGDLGPSQTRILLACLIALGQAPDTIAAALAQRGALTS